MIIVFIQKKHLMLASKLQTIRLLNGLRLLNLERINGYNKALGLMNADAGAGLQNISLQMLLSNFVRDSIFFSSTLENIVLIEGGKMPYGIKVDQQLYQSIRDLQALFSNMEHHSILSCCENCENSIQSAYNAVLSKTELAYDPRIIIKNQQAELKKAQELISRLQQELGTAKGVVVDLYNQPGLKLGS